MRPCNKRAGMSFSTFSQAVSVLPPLPSICLFFPLFLMCSSQHLCPLPPLLPWEGLALISSQRRHIQSFTDMFTTTQTHRLLCFLESLTPQRWCRPNQHQLFTPFFFHLLHFDGSYSVTNSTSTARLSLHVAPVQRVWS